MIGKVGLSEPCKRNSKLLKNDAQARETLALGFRTTVTLLGMASRFGGTAGVSSRTHDQRCRDDAALGAQGKGDDGYRDKAQQGRNHIEMISNVAIESQCGRSGIFWIDVTYWNAVVPKCVSQKVVLGKIPLARVSPTL
ncbi:MAG: hypothetical protein NDI73_11140 [Desulfuromonadales bacterium]|nr:hypothetical protein [Desulfuromonadales bacterium]